jgi:hypothetical protein
MNFNLGSGGLIDHCRNDTGLVCKEEARSKYRSAGAKTGCSYEAAA